MIHISEINDTTVTTVFVKHTMCILKTSYDIYCSGIGYYSFDIQKCNAIEIIVLGFNIIMSPIALSWNKEN